MGPSPSTIVIDDHSFLIFESKTVLGFVFSYDSPKHLIEHWSEDSDRAIAKYQFGLRRAGQKAWNTYAVLFAIGAADDSLSFALSAIEENLVATRKIVRAGIADDDDLRGALLPLLPLQNNPLLEAVDFVAEIRLRTTELPARAFEAFTSGTDLAVVLQVLEETP